MCQARPGELVEVIKYFRDEFDTLWRNTQTAHLKLSETLIKAGVDLLRAQQPHPAPEKDA